MESQFLPSIMGIPLQKQKENIREKTTKLTLAISANS